MNCLLLAAGYATRLHPLTENFPKPLLQVGEQTILDRLVDQIEGSNRCERILIVTNNRFVSHFEIWADKRRKKRVPNDLLIINDGSNTNEERLGAIGDMHFVLSLHEFQFLRHADLVVCACDNLVDFDFRVFLDFYDKKMEPAVAVHPELDRKRLEKVGVVVLGQDGYVEDMEEKPTHPKSSLATSPFYVFPPNVLKLIPVYLLEGGNPDAPGHFISWLARRTKVRGFLFDDPVYALDTVDAYNWLNANIETLAIYQSFRK